MASETDTAAGQIDFMAMNKQVGVGQQQALKMGSEPGVCSIVSRVLMQDLSGELIISGQMR